MNINNNLGRAQDHDGYSSDSSSNDDINQVDDKSVNPRSMEDNLGVETSTQVTSAGSYFVVTAAAIVTAIIILVRSLKTILASILAAASLLETTSRLTDSGNSSAVTGCNPAIACSVAQMCCRIISTVAVLAFLLQLGELSRRSSK
ncbi:hypothetical protein [Candidatus Ichthyocystis hellenicum]|uniref:hypothetical protein n=1 Tax=Candidatus Ichthyocystis hellenicum TaxID=1561003 RepID=UPI000B82947C|nr:hypothetical protein [Candidatus Ichthyocystis hellenicum]